MQELPVENRPDVTVAFSFVVLHVLRAFDLYRHQGLGFSIYAPIILLIRDLCEARHNLFLLQNITLCILVVRAFSTKMLGYPASH